MKKLIFITPANDRPDPPSLKSVREKIRAQRSENVHPLGILPRADGWNPRVLDD